MHPPELPAAYEAMLDRNAAAAQWFATQSKSYRRNVVMYVMSAKQEATKQRRMQLLADACARRELMRQVVGARRAEASASRSSTPRA